MVHEPKTSKYFKGALGKTETRDQISNIHWIIDKAREFQKNIYFCFINYKKAFVCMDHSKLGKILKEIAIPDHLPWLLRNLHAGQESSQNCAWNNELVQNWERSTSGCIVSPCLFNLYAEYIRQNMG